MISAGSGFNGGSVSISSGKSDSNGKGGSLMLSGDSSVKLSSSSPSGSVEISSGSSLSESSSGSLFIGSGDSQAGSAGGIKIISGKSASSSRGSDLTLKSGDILSSPVDLSMNYNVYSRRSKCDFFIEPHGLGKFGVFDIKKAPELFQAGYDRTMEYIEENPSILELAVKTKKSVSV